MPERSFDPVEVVRFLQSCQAGQFDLALQLHGNGTITNPLLMLLGARRLAGFFGPAAVVPDAETFIAYPEDKPEVCRLLSVVEHLGFGRCGTELEFPMAEADLEAFAELNVTGGEYVCVHPGARDPSRCWPPAHFASVADALADQGLQVVLTGSSFDAARIAEVQNAMRHTSINLAGATNLGTLAALLQSARLVVCGDTGVSHLAAAVRTPSVVIFLSSDPQRWAPLDAQRHRVLFRPCSVDAVLAAAGSLLGAAV